MGKHAFIAIILSLALLPVRAQLDSEHQRAVYLLTPCEKQLLDGRKIIPQLYEEGKVDSIRPKVEAYNLNCDPDPLLQYIVIIDSLSKNKIAVDSIDQFLKNLIGYKEALPYAWGKKSFDREPQEFAKHPDWKEVTFDFYRFLQNYANDVLTKNETEGIHTELLQFYRGETDILLKDLRRNNWKETELQKEFNEWKNTLVYDEGMWFGFGLGAWIPMDNLHSVGNHPEIYAQAGYFKERFKVGASLGIRFLDAPSEYRIRQNDSIYEMTDFSGFQGGIDVGWALFKKAHHEMDFNLGVAYDEIVMIPADEEGGVEGVKVNTVNLNLGFEYRMYYNLRNFVALDARYHYLNYSNNIDDALAGSAITLRLIWGFTTSYRRAYELKMLGY